MIEVGVDTYISVEDADTYITEHYVSGDERRQAWESLEPEDKEVYLRRAARAIDSLPYPGAKCSRDQVMAFPRVVYACGCGASEPSDVPTAVKAVQAEEAFELGCPSAAAGSIYNIAASMGVKAFSYDRYSITYGESGNGSSLDDTISSDAARELLRPFAGGGFCVR